MSSHLLDLLCRSRYYYNFLFRSPKAGAHAKLCVQLKGHEASSKALEDLDNAKSALETSWQDLLPQLQHWV